MLSVPSRGQFCFQPQISEHKLSRGHSYTSLASEAGDFRSLIPGNFSFSHKHFRLMIKMEAGAEGEEEQQLLRTLRAKGPLITLRAN